MMEQTTQYLQCCKCGKVRSKYSIDNATNNEVDLECKSQLVWSMLQSIAPVPRCLLPLSAPPSRQDDADLMRRHCQSVFVSVCIKTKSWRSLSFWIAKLHFLPCCNAQLDVISCAVTILASILQAATLVTRDFDMSATLHDTSCGDMNAATRAMQRNVALSTLHRRLILQSLVGQHLGLSMQHYSGRMVFNLEKPNVNRIR